jgi:hypothetical protein
VEFTRLWMGTEAGYCEYGNERLDSIICGEFLGCPSVLLLCSMELVMGFGSKVPCIHNLGNICIGLCMNDMCQADTAFSPRELLFSLFFKKVK